MDQASLTSGTASHKRVLAYAQIVRVPNLITAVADVLAGFFFAGGRPDEWHDFVRLAAASVFLYAGGVTFNDVCDVEQDAAERPHRPIPSEGISHDRAVQLAATLFGLALILAWSVSWQALAVSTAILVCIILYNLLKPTALAVPMMGMCRAFNLLLGMHGLESLAPLSALRPMSAMWLYVTCVTFFARREARGGSRGRLSIGIAGILAALVGLWQLRWYGYNARHDGYRWLVLAMAIGVLVRGLPAVWSPTPERIQRAVKELVLWIVLVDACVAWVSAGPMAGLVVTGLLVPCLVLARFFRVT